MPAELALLAMLIELCIGYPQWLTRAIGHPVTWMGGLIARSNRFLNRDTAPSPQRRLLGALSLVIMLGLVGAAAFVVQSQLLRLPYGLLAVAVLASTMIAQRSLYR